jgi:hypothetical protein
MLIETLLVALKGPERFVECTSPIAIVDRGRKWFTHTSDSVTQKHKKGTEKRSHGTLRSLRIAATSHAPVARKYSGNARHA